MTVDERSLLPFERAARERSTRLAQPAAVGLGSLAAGGTCAVAGQVAGGNWHFSQLDQFTPAGEAYTHLRWASGAMAAVNAGIGLYKIFNEPMEMETEKAQLWRRISGGANLVVAAGLVGQALGWGPWTMAISAVGIVGTVVADTVRSMER